MIGIFYWFKYEKTAATKDSRPPSNNQVLSQPYPHAKFSVE